MKNLAQILMLAIVVAIFGACAPNVLQPEKKATGYIAPQPEIVKVAQQSQQEGMTQYAITYCINKFGQGVYENCMLIGRFGIWPEKASESQKIFFPEFTIVSGEENTQTLTAGSLGKENNSKLWLTISYAQAPNGSTLPMYTPNGVAMPNGVYSSPANLP